MATTRVTKTETIGAPDAKTHLARLLRGTAAGRTFIITKRGKPVAELRPVEMRKARKWGDMKGKIRVVEDFCAPLDDMKNYME